jgi:hypothetical protein
MFLRIFCMSVLSLQTANRCLLTFAMVVITHCSMMCKSCPAFCALANPFIIFSQFMTHRVTLTIHFSPQHDVQELSRILCACQSINYAPTLTTPLPLSSLTAHKQHDVQELSRILCDRLAKQFKGTPVETAIADMFQVSRGVR